MFRAPALPRTLLAALRDIHAVAPKIRAEAARDLARHVEAARESVVPALTSALRDEIPSVRAAAALALADIDALEALDALLLALDDTDIQVRQMAITALGELGDARATEPLRRSLQDDVPEVRFQAVIAFPRVCSARSESIDALIAATRDADPLVCHIALRMAEEVGHDEGGEGDGVDPRILLRARALLRHDADVVRVAAAIVLARAGEPSGASVLVEVSRGTIKTPDGEDEAAAIELCGDLRLELSRTSLERRAFGGATGLRRDRFAWHARVALACMGHERACREIVRDLGAWDRDKRTLAVAAAGRARLEAARGAIIAMRGDERSADPHAVEEALARIVGPVGGS